jgi:hypothetical protein
MVKLLSFDFCRSSFDRKEYCSKACTDYGGNDYTETGGNGLENRDISEYTYGSY